MRRPESGQELMAMQIACNRAAQLLNTTISRPSLGNVTPAELAEGRAEDVQRRNQEFIEQSRQTRKDREPAAREPWRKRISDLVDLSKWRTERLLGFLRLSKRDYSFLAN